MSISTKFFSKVVGYRDSIKQENKGLRSSGAHDYIPDYRDGVMQLCCLTTPCCLLWVLSFKYNHTITQSLQRYGCLRHNNTVEAIMNQGVGKVLCADHLTLTLATPNI